MPLILLLIAAAVLFKFAWLLAAVAVAAAVGWGLREVVGPPRGRGGGATAA